MIHYLSSILRPSTSAQPVTATGAALIATFYGSRKAGRLQPLVTLLCKKLSLEPLKQDVGGVLQEVADNWVNEGGPSLLARFDPTAASDTTVVQLALNQGGEVAQAWADLGQKLSLALDEESLKAVRGYTLTYLALSDDLPVPSEAPIHPTLEHLLAHAQPLHRQSTSTPTILAHTTIKSGQIWLLNLPIDPHGVELGTVYVALGPRKQPNELIEEVLYGRHAQLLMPDLIAHKAYHQRRQYYQGEVKRRYEQFAKQLRQSADSLLAAPDTQAHLSEIKKLEQDYRQFIRTLPLFRELRLSMARQQHNFERWQPQLPHDGNLLTLHQAHIETIYRELEILVDKGEDTQTAVESTIRLLQTELQQRTEQRERTFQYWLALIGIMLAGPQFVSENVAQKLLTTLHLPDSWAKYINLSALSAIDDIFLVLAIQIIGTFLVGFIMWAIVSAWRWWRGE